MHHVVVVAPFFGGNMTHCLRCFAAIEESRLGLITQEPKERIPADLRDRIADHFQVENALDPEQLVMATRAYQRSWGRVDRLAGYLEPLQVPLGFVRDRLQIDGLGEREARNFRDKNQMKQVLGEAGLPVARQARIFDGAGARQFVAQVGYPIVMKPLDGAGARNTWRIPDDEHLNEALNRLLPSPSRPVQAEQFIDGEEHTYETVFIGGQPVWSSSVFYLPGPLTVLENDWMQYCMLLPREHPLQHVRAFAPLNQRALGALGMRNGLSHMEWFLRRDGSAFVSEVGARPPGDKIMLMNSAAHDDDMWARWARLVVKRTWNMPPRKYATGCAFVRAMGPGRTVTAVHGLDHLKTSLAGQVVASRLPQPGQPRSAGYEGDGWVVVRHHETQGVVDALGEIVTRLRIE